MKKNIFNCLFLTLLSGLSSIATYGQVSNPTNIWSNTSDYVGWSTSHDVLFKINGTQYLTLKTSGDLNVVAGAKGYQINGNYVLRHDGNPNNIFVGVDAGNSGMTSSYNTFMGKTAGNLNAAADNTFVGSYCGAFNYSGEQNTFTGSESGQFNSSGHDNSFLGFHSGGANQYGHYNTFIGSVAGAGNGGVGVFDADNNTAVGYYAGANNIEGYENLFLGANANAYYTSGINNSCAIGCNTMVRTPNTVILGNNLMNVGIGLSDIAGGPLANLHVFRDHFVNVTDPTAVFVENNDVDKDGDYYGNAYGIRVRTLGANLFNYGGHFKAENATINTAGRFEATSIAAINSGGYFIAANAEESNIGLSSHALDGQLSEGGIFSGSNAVTNFGVDATADAALNNDYNFGVKGLANPGRNTIFNVGVLGEAPVNSPDPSAGLGTWAVYAD